MILALDAGNTNVVLGCIDGEKIIFECRIATELGKTEYQYAAEFDSMLKMGNVNIKKTDGCIISSVVPPLTSILKSALKMVSGKSAMTLGPGIKTGLNIRLDNPAQLGSDQVADAVGAIHYYNAPLIVFDMGTATTVSVIDQNKNYIGGMIFPGVKISQEALTARTSQLPKISLEPPKKIIGVNTIECMKSGAIYANAAMADGVVERIEEELGMNTTVVATGGLSGSIMPFCKHKIIVDNELMLRGLKIIYDKNK